VPDRPALPPGWHTGGKHQVTLRRRRGRSELLSVKALEPDLFRHVSRAFVRQRQLIRSLSMLRSDTRARRRGSWRNLRAIRPNPSGSIDETVTIPRSKSLSAGFAESPTVAMRLSFPFSRCEHEQGDAGRACGSFRLHATLQNDDLPLIYEVRYHTDFPGLRRMARRQKVLTDLARQIVRLSPDRIVRVAIDGVDGAGKTTLANELADAIRPLRRSVIRASVDGFHNPRAVRSERGRILPRAISRIPTTTPPSLGPAKSWRLPALSRRQFLIMSRTCRYRSTSERRVSILLFDGIFLDRPELLRYWDASIFLRADFAVSVARCSCS
jgi:uridine kinase